MNRWTKLLVYVGLSFGFMVLGLIFAIYVVPMFLWMFPQRTWAMWLLSGLFMGPYMLFMIYVVVRITGSLWQFDRWQWEFVLVGTPLSLMYLSALGYIFSFVIPDDFEPFRSVTLPAMVLAVTLLAFGRTEYAKKHRVYPRKQMKVQTLELPRKGGHNKACLPM